MKRLFSVNWARAVALSAAALFLANAFALAGESLLVELRDGSSIQASSATINETTATIDSGSPIPREEIKELRVVRGKPGASAPLAPATQTQAMQLFASARKLLSSYPDAGALLLTDEGDFAYESDGSWTETLHTTVFIAKESKKEEFGYISVYQEPGRSRAAILRADIYFPDGRIARMEPQQVRKVSPQDHDDFFITGGEQLIYELRGLETGCIADYVTQTKTFNPHRSDFFMPGWYFQSELPSASSRVRIAVPSGTDLHYAARNFPPGQSQIPALTSSGAVKTYEWAFGAMPPVSMEPEMPAMSDVVPSLKASLLPGWDQVYSWSSDLLLERSRPSEKLRAFALALTQNDRTQTQKAATLYHYVQKSIRYVAVKAGIASGFGGYPADQTWQRGWGCCIDKAVLLAAMLNSAGIEAFPAYLNTNLGETTETRVPNLLFDHAITVATVEGKRVFLDSTGYDYRYPSINESDHGAWALIPSLRELNQIPVPAPRENAEFHEYRLALSRNGDAQIKTDISYSGAAEAQMRGFYRERKPDERRLSLQQFAKQLSPRAELKEWDARNFDFLEKPFTVSLEIKAPSYAAVAGPLFILTLPDLALHPSELAAVAGDRRSYPIQHESALGQYYTYTLRMPSGLAPVELPDRLAVSSKHFDFSLECSAQSAETITCRASQERKSRLIPAQDYQAYKQALEQAAKISRTRLVFKADK